MKKLNNKGYMLVEIIVATVLALVIAYFLMNITIKMVNLNNDYYVESVLTADKAVITKEIMDDLSSKELIEVTTDVENQKITLKFVDNTEKDLSVEENNNKYTVIYGDFKKEISSYLNIKGSGIVTRENGTNTNLNFQIPAYSNYSNDNYGISINVPVGPEVPSYKEDYIVNVTVLNGTTNYNKLTATSVFGNLDNNFIFVVTPDDGYSSENPTISCPNASYTYSSNNLQVSNLTTSEVTCTVTFAKQVPQDNSGANTPELTDGLIPVMYYNNTWVVADQTNTNPTYLWYNYDNKIWANAVLVNDTLRNSLTKDSDGKYTPGQKIGDTEAEGVLAFYVWIPRYKYKVWNITKTIGTSMTTDPSTNYYYYDAYNEGIDIIFENQTETTGTISCTYNFGVTDGSLSETCSGSNGSYYTHPAFTFGSSELTGIWVGKFEVSSADQTASNYGGGTSITLTPRILPNVMSWRKNYIGHFYQVLRNMQNSNNIYGLSISSSVVDTHLATNLEWGAMAYLTHSKYGRCTNNTCTEISANNSYESSYYTNYTGRSAGVPASSASTSESGTYEYNTEGGVLASTTGNIYGIYDVSGGGGDFVMGNMSAQTGSYGQYQGYSGDTTTCYYTYSSSTAKYITTYAYMSYSTGVYQENYNRARLGDATSEVVLGQASIVASWYGNSSNFPNSTALWIFRGGTSSSIARSGIFAFVMNSGRNYTNATARATLVVFP